MSDHKPPEYDAKLKSDTNGGWTTVGAAWTTAKADVLSVKLTSPVDSFILVKRKPKTVAAEPAAPVAKKTPNANRKAAL